MKERKVDETVFLADMPHRLMMRHEVYYIKDVNVGADEKQKKCLDAQAGDATNQSKM